MECDSRKKNSLRARASAGACENYSPHTPRNAAKVDSFLALEGNHQTLPQILFLVLHDFRKGILEQVFASDCNLAITCTDTLSRLRAEVDLRRKVRSDVLAARKPTILTSLRRKSRFD